MITGQCLCAAVRFSLTVEPRFFYRCHCSLCRKQTGVGFNLATLLNARDFRWDAGQDSINSWIKPSGYRNDFCAQCGSTVPNPLRGSPYVWIPLGLLDEDLNVECIGDFVWTMPCHGIHSVRRRVITVRWSHWRCFCKNSGSILIDPKLALHLLP